MLLIDEMNVFEIYKLARHNWASQTIELVNRRWKITVDSEEDNMLRLLNRESGALVGEWTR